MQIKPPAVINPFANALTQGEFDRIKALRDFHPEWNPRRISLEVGRSESVVIDALTQPDLQTYFRVRKDRWRVYHGPTEAKPNPPKEKPPTTTGMPTKQQYDIVKELDYRGEALSEITRRTGHAYTTVIKMIEARTYEDYLAVKKPEPEPLTEALNHAPEVKQPLPQDTSRYLSLDRMRKHLDNMLTEFLVAEAKASYKDLLTRIYELEHENDLLKRRLAEHKDPFISTLKEKMGTITGDETSSNADQRGGQ